MEEATLKDLAFTSRSSRESDEVGPDGCVSTVESKGAVLMEARGHYGVALYKHAEFQQSREDREGNGVKNLSGA